MGEEGWVAENLRKVGPVLISQLDEVEVGANGSVVQPVGELEGEDILLFEYVAIVVPILVILMGLVHTLSFLSHLGRERSWL